MASSLQRYRFLQTSFLVNLTMVAMITLNVIITMVTIMVDLIPQSIGTISRIWKSDIFVIVTLYYFYNINLCSIRNYVNIVCR